MAAVEIAQERIIRELGRTYAALRNCASEAERDDLIARLYLEVRARTEREAELEREVETLKRQAHSLGLENEQLASRLDIVRGLLRSAFEDATADDAD